MLLVMTPLPYPDESLSGFMICVAEANGYESMADILSIAGASNRWRGGWKLELGRIEKILNFSPGQLRPLSYTKSGAQSAKSLLLGQDVSRMHLTGAKPRVCPDCVEELGYISANWDLRFMIACPKHRRSAVFRCLECGKALSLYRPKLLECRCGADLRNHPVEPAEDHVLEMLSVLAAKALKQECPTVSAYGLPMANLAAMSLRALLLTVASLGRLRLENLRLSAHALELSVGHAASALSQWPEGFRALLRETSAEANQGTALNFKRAFRGLYERLFQRGLPLPEVVFVRRAFVEFGVDEWTNGHVDPRLLRGISTEGRRYLSVSHLARDLGIMQSTARRWVREGLVSMTQIGHTTRRYVGVTGAMSAPRRAAGKSFGDREASAYLGIPVSVLKALRGSGHFEVRHIGKILKSFHEADVRSFNDRCLVIADRNAPTGAGWNAPASSISLAAALKTLRFLSPEAKRDLVVAFLRGDIRCLGRSGERMGGILLDVEQVRKFQMDSRSAIFQSARSATEVAVLLQCDILVVASLVHQGFLEALPGTAYLRVTEASCAAFGERYIPAKEVAKRHAVGIRRVLGLCAAAGITMIAAERAGGGSKQLFIRREDEGIIEAKILARQEKARKRSNQWERLKNYLDSLRNTGALLPRRAGLPNKVAIAKAAEIDRNFIYMKECMALIESFDIEDRNRASIEKRDDLAALKRYLAEIKRQDISLPRLPGGRPNKCAIAKASGFDRNIFYSVPTVAATLEDFARNEGVVSPSDR